MKRILFVCTGNTCRSPMAEGMMRKLLEQEGLSGYEVRSAGISAYDGMPTSEHAASVLKQRGGCGPAHATMLSQAHIDWADLVLTMTSAHKRHAIQLYPEAVDKVYTLKEYVQNDPNTAAKISEMESLISEIQLKTALAQPVSEEERKKLAALEKLLPNPDIADPFGGSLSSYQRCADEIEACLVKLVSKLKTLR